MLVHVHVRVSIYIVSDLDITLSNKVRKAILSILFRFIPRFKRFPPLHFALLKNDLLTIRAVLCRKRA